MNTIDIQQGERLSFFKLFSEKNYRVCIPIIQRDYAQGRQTSKEVRDNFLTALYDYLDGTSPVCWLLCGKGERILRRIGS